MATTASYRSARYSVHLAENAEHTQVTSETIGTGDGSTATFSATLANSSVEGGSITVTDGTETFTDNNDGTLTGSAGGTGTYNTETGAISVTFNANVTNAQAITAGYWYLNVGGSDWSWFEDFTMTFQAPVDDQTPATGALAGALPVNGDYWYDVSGMRPLFPCSDWADVTGEVVATGDGSATTFSFTLAFPGIHADGAYTTPTGHNTILISDGVEDIEDDGDGTLTGSLGGSGTINYATGAVSVTFNTAPTNLTDITADYCYLPLPDVDAIMRMSHERTWAEANGYGRWQYSVDECNQAEVGIRCIDRATDCSTGYDKRGSRCRMVPVIKATGGDRVMMELSGNAAARTAPSQCNLPTLPTLTSAKAFVHNGCTVTIVAKDQTSGSTLGTYGGRLVGAFEYRTPFTAERLTTASGDDNGGTAEVVIGAEANARVESDAMVQLTKPSSFDWRLYWRDGQFIEKGFDWVDRATGRFHLKYDEKGYLFDCTPEVLQKAIMVNAKTRATWGIAGDSNPGRDTTLDLGRWSFQVDKD